jgi:hypothetical protein
MNSKMQREGTGTWLTGRFTVEKNETEYSRNRLRSMAQAEWMHHSAYTLHSAEGITNASPEVALFHRRYT